MADKPSDIGSQEKESKRAILTKLVFVPLLIVAIAVAIFLFFGWLTYDHKSAEEFLADIKTASMSKKWQAAFVLAGKLRDRESIQDPERLFQEMAAIFKNVQAYDERVRSYMALAIGNLGDPRGVEILEDAARNEKSDVRIYALWGLGSLKDKRSVPLLIELSGDPDNDVRKTAVYLLGSLEDKQAISALRRALEDPVTDVQWNAALGLARLGDKSGVSIIRRLLDRSYFQSFSEMNAQSTSEIIINALRAVAYLEEKELLSVVEKLSREDSDMQVRRAAHDVLKVLEAN